MPRDFEPEPEETSILLVEGVTLAKPSDQSPVRESRVLLDKWRDRLTSGITLRRPPREHEL